MRTLISLLIALACQIGMGSEYIYDSRGNLKEVRVNTEQPYYNPNNNRSIRGYNNGGKPTASKKHKKLETKKIKVKQIKVKQK